MNRYWENGSGCYDPTAKEAIDKQSLDEKARNKEIHDTIQEVKNILRNKKLELVGRMVIQDKVTNKKYK